MSETRRYSTVLIDGIQYLPLEQKPLDDEARRLLCEVYGALWTEANYDPNNDDTRKFAKPLSDKMMRLNKLLGFKQ